VLGGVVLGGHRVEVLSRSLCWWLITMRGKIVVY